MPLDGWRDWRKHYIYRFFFGGGGAWCTFFVEVEQMPLENDGLQPIDQSAAEPVGDGGASSESLVTPEIEAKFAEVFGGGGSGTGDAAARQRQADAEQQEELDEAAQADADPAAAGAKSDDGEEQGETQADDPDKAPDAKGKPAAPAPGEDAARAAATLSPVLRQAAQRAGWSKEDIDGFYAQNAGLAERTFERLHGSFNDLSSRYAQLGQAPNPRGAQTTQSAPTAPSATAATPATSQQLDALFTEAALKQFGEDNGQDLVEKLLKPLGTEVIQPFRQMKAEMEQMKAWAAAQQSEALAKEVNLVFKGWEDEFADLYGKNGQTSKQQHDARAQVAQLADQIMAGAAMQGVQLSVSDALERAHALHTADRRNEIERQRLVAQVKGRASRITARPTQRKIARTVDDGAARGDKAAMEAVGNFWAERGS